MKGLSGGRTVSLPGRTGVRIAWLVLAAALLAGRAVSGLEPTSTLAHYGYDAWDSDSGLPQNSVDTILQTRDGYLWLGTQEGLVRFDGVHFQMFDTRNTEALGDDYVRDASARRRTATSGSGP